MVPHLPLPCLSCLPPSQTKSPPIAARHLLLSEGLHDGGWLHLLRRSVKHTSSLPSASSLEKNCSLWEKFFHATGEKHSELVSSHAGSLKQKYVLGKRQQDLPSPLVHSKCAVFSNRLSANSKVRTWISRPVCVTISNRPTSIRPSRRKWRQSFLLLPHRFSLLARASLFLPSFLPSSASIIPPRREDRAHNSSELRQRGKSESLHPSASPSSQSVDRVSDSGLVPPCPLAICRRRSIASEA